MTELVSKLLSDNTLMLGLVATLISITALFFGIKINREKFLKAKYLLQSKYVNYQINSIHRKVSDLQAEKELVKRLLPDLRSDDPEIKIKALQILLHIHTDETIDALLEYLINEKDRNIKYMILRLLSDQIKLIKK